MAEIISAISISASSGTVPRILLTLTDQSFWRNRTVPSGVPGLCEEDLTVTDLDGDAVAVVVGPAAGDGVELSIESLGRGGRDR